MGGLFSGPPRLPPSNRNSEEPNSSPWQMASLIDESSAGASAPLPPPASPRTPTIPVADKALARRPGRQSTILSMVEEEPSDQPPVGADAARDSGPRPARKGRLLRHPKPMAATRLHPATKNCSPGSCSRRLPARHMHTRILDS